MSRHKWTNFSFFPAKVEEEKRIADCEKCRMERWVKSKEGWKADIRYILNGEIVQDWQPTSGARVPPCSETI